MRTPRSPSRRRRRFSLNGLAIQLSAFALSFTLVALLVVTGSQAAFVEENESVTNHVPIGTPAEDDPAPRRPAGPAPASEPTSGTTAPVPSPEEDAEAPTVAVALTDSDAGSAMFTDGTALVPGVTLTRCIEVAYEGTTHPTPILLYAASSTGDLAAYLDLTVQIGQQAAGSFGACDGFASAETLFSGTLAEFAAEHSDHDGGLPTWEPAGTRDSRSFRFSVSVRDEPAASGRSVSFGFTWETRGD